MLWHTLAGLPELYRKPMVLFYREQQSINEVAEGLDVPEDVVRQREVRRIRAETGTEGIMDAHHPETSSEEQS